MDICWWFRARASCSTSDRKVEGDTFRSFRTIAEALEIVGQRHADLRKEVEGLAPEQHDFRPVADRWTIAEIVEPVAIVQEGMGKIASKLVKEAMVGKPNFTASRFLFQERHRDPSVRQQLRRRLEDAGLPS